MSEYTINITEVEELQTISNTAELNIILNRAHSMIVQGGTVILCRQNPDGSTYNFDELSTEADLELYKKSVLKYL